MPKIRRSRVKLHDLAPGPARGGLAPWSSGRLHALTTGNADGGGGDGTTDDASEGSIVSSFRDRPRDNSISGAYTPGSKEALATSAWALGGHSRRTTDDVTNSMKLLSRGQRRRAEKRDAWLRKFDFPKYAQQLREEQRRQELKDSPQESPLATFAPALRQQLNDADVCHSTEAEVLAGGRATAGNGRKRVTRKYIQRLAEKEVAQYRAVVAFSAFRASPLAVLKEHLKNTISMQQKTKENPTFVFLPSTQPSAWRIMLTGPNGPLLHRSHSRQRHKDEALDRYLVRLHRRRRGEGLPALEGSRCISKVVVRFSKPHNAKEVLYNAGFSCH
ncbi:unnamed protein product [Rangifer tarandus platyrhynchus]|uniref:Uncharacterized protein n=1 Tax=Rangifer tarandus platyrhynchus TaxID=3082113 RepID=A0ABN8XIQ9_RANTA|nr:unnamed protein product [Rangifer tarandus platyrhynchus]